MLCTYVVHFRCLQSYVVYLGKGRMLCFIQFKQYQLTLTSLVQKIINKNEFYHFYHNQIIVEKFVVSYSISLFFQNLLIIFLILCYYCCY